MVEKGDHVAVKYTGWLAGAAGVGTKGALFDTNDTPDGRLLKIKACLMFNAIISTPLQLCSSMLFGVQSRPCAGTVEAALPS